MSFDKKEQKIKDLLSQLTPEQQGIAQGITQLRVENDLLRAQNAKLNDNYQDLYRLFITLLHNAPGQKFEMHESQLLRFKEEYRIDRRRLKDGILVYRLLTVHDDVPGVEEP